MATSNTPQNFALFKIFINSSQMAMASSYSLKRMSNSQPVETLALQYAGESPGAARCECSITVHVPSADFELNPGKFIIKGQSVQLDIVHPNGKTMTSKGFIIDDNLDQAVNSAVKLVFNFRGGFSDFV
jgi:hypothetical protein